MPPWLFTLVTGPKRSLSLKLSDTRLYEPQLKARLGTTAHVCEMVVRKLPALFVCSWGTCRARRARASMASS